MSGPSPKLKKISAAPQINAGSGTLYGNIDYQKIPSSLGRVVQNYDGTYSPVDGYDYNSRMVSIYGEDWIRNWGIDLGAEVGKTALGAAQLAPGASGIKVLSFAVARTSGKGLITTLGQYAKGEDITLGKNLLSEFITPSNYKGYSKVDVSSQVGILNKTGAVINNTGYYARQGFEAKFGTFGKVRGDGTIIGASPDFKQKLGNNFVLKEPTFANIAPQVTIEKAAAKKLFGQYKTSDDITEVDAQLAKYTEGWPSQNWVSLNNLVERGGYSIPEAIHTINDLDKKYDIPYLGGAIGYAEQIKWETRNTWATKQLADYYWEQGTKTKDQALAYYTKAKNAFRNGEILEGVKSVAGVTLYSGVTFSNGVLSSGFQFFRTAGEGLVTAAAGLGNIFGKTGQILEGVVQGAIPRVQPHVFVKRDKNGQLNVVGIDYEDDNLRVEMGYAKNLRTAKLTEEESSQIGYLVENNAIRKIYAPHYFEKQPPSWSNTPEVEEDRVRESQAITLEEVRITAKPTTTTKKDKYGREWTYKLKNGKYTPVSYVEKGKKWEYDNGVSYQIGEKIDGVPKNTYKSTYDFALAQSRVKIDMVAFTKSLKSQKPQR